MMKEIKSKSNSLRKVATSRTILEDGTILMCHVTVLDEHGIVITQYPLLTEESMTEWFLEDIYIIKGKAFLQTT